MVPRLKQKHKETEQKLNKSVTKQKTNHRGSTCKKMLGNIYAECIQFWHNDVTANSMAHRNSR